MRSSWEWLRKKIISFVRENPGCTGRQMADHFNMTTDDLNKRYREMVAAGMLRRDGERNQTRWWVV